MDFDTTTSDGVRKNLNHFSIFILIFFITDAQIGTANDTKIALLGGTFAIEQSSTYWLFLFLYVLFVYMTWRFATLWNRSDLLNYIVRTPLIGYLQFEPISKLELTDFFDKQLIDTYQFSHIGKKWGTHFTYYSIAIGTKQDREEPVVLGSGEDIKVSIRMDLTVSARILSGYGRNVVHIPVSSEDKIFDLPEGVCDKDEIIMSMGFYKALRCQVFTHTTYLADTFLPWALPICAHALVVHSFYSSVTGNLN